MRFIIKKNFYHLLINLSVLYGKSKMINEKCNIHSIPPLHLHPSIYIISQL